MAISGRFVNYHPLHNDNLGAQLFVNGEDVDETQREDHKVYSQHRPSCLVGVVRHPAKNRACRRVCRFVRHLLPPSTANVCNTHLHETPTTKSDMATMSHLFQLSST